MVTINRSLQTDMLEENIENNFFVAPLLSSQLLCEI